MSKELMDIADIQCCFFGMAQKKWNSSGKECSDIFQKHYPQLSEVKVSHFIGLYACKFR